MENPALMTIPEAWRDMRRIRHVHFVGIGGAGMSGIAEVLLNLVMTCPVPTCAPARSPHAWNAWARLCIWAMPPRTSRVATRW